MTWPNVGVAYNKLFRKYLGLSDRPEIRKLPKVNISHLVRLTDDFGVVQFANQSKPDVSSGYTLDDNARALLVCIMHYEKFREYKQLSLMKTYLDYIKYVQDENGKLFNYVDNTKAVDYQNWSADAHGRALWALGYLISSPMVPEDFKKEAENVFLKALAVDVDIKYPRSLAFMINGLYFYNKLRKSDEVIKNIRKFADYLVSLYETNAHSGWGWFEPFLTYANSKIPEALFYSYLSTGDVKYLTAAKKSFDFLISKTFKNNIFMPIGQRGWYFEGGERAYYDQQPIDVAYTVQTLLLAYSITKESRYKKLALNSFLWFLGKNTLNQVVYNDESGSCYDGVGEKAVNLNQGAEATLSYLIARLSLASSS
jgi:uncharacterized protein YyaL (SSP411 family)